MRPGDYVTVYLSSDRDDPRPDEDMRVGEYLEQILKAALPDLMVWAATEIESQRQHIVSALTGDA